MRLHELTGIYHYMDTISPEAMREQRMAELEQMAKYRALKLQQYKDWSDPVKRAAIQARYVLEEAVSRKDLVNIPAELVAVRRYESPLNVAKIIFKPAPKLTLWQRIKQWITSRM